MNIILATDSRGRGLNTYLQKMNPFPPNWHVYLLFKPGASIERLSHEAQLLIQSSSDKTAPYHVVFMGGICNLTEKFKHQSGTEIVYQHSSDKVQMLLHSIEKTFHQISLSPSSIVQFATIPPVSIKKFKEYQSERGNLKSSKYSSDESAAQQEALENDIKFINNKISQYNANYNSSSIRLDKDITKISIKKRGRNGTCKKRTSKFFYDNFYDGVHPERSLAEKWFLRICSSIVNFQNSKLIDIDVSDDEEEEINTWDFKRN